MTSPSGLNGRFIGSGKPNDVEDDDLVQYRLEGEDYPRQDKAGNVAWDGVDGVGAVEAYKVLVRGSARINPKDRIGSHKLPLHLWPAEATAMGCLGLLDGKGKYGRDNYVAGDGVIASIYVDACKRHLDAWWAGEERDRDSKLPHMAHALACLAILVKAQAHGKLIDDRGYDPNGSYRRLVDEITPLVKVSQEEHADKSPKHWTIDDARRERS